MTKYTANLVGVAKSEYGSGAWDLYDQGELYRRGNWAISLGIGVSGGNILNGVTKTVGANNFKYHTFTENGTLTVGEPKVVDVLVVAGGGAGGYGFYDENWPTTFYGGGGGGAGGVVYASQATLDAGVYQISVGAGGTNTKKFSNGEDSFVKSLISNNIILLAKGGGYGGDLSNFGGTGGSGGGASRNQPGISTATQPTVPQSLTPLPINSGNSGRNNTGQFGGGGGGASPSATTPTTRGGDGVLVTPNYLDFYGDTIGIPALNPLNGYFGGGGGPGGYGTPYPYPEPAALGQISGGLGGGGRGGAFGFSGPPFVQGAAAYLYETQEGVKYSGGGGGGGHGYLGTFTISTGVAPFPVNSKAIFGTPGASGIVVIRYQV